MKEQDDKPKTSNDRWVSAHNDPMAGIYTLSQCVTLSDVNSDGDWKLILADLGQTSNNVKLKVYKGTQCVSENTLLDLPTGVVTFYMDTNEPHTPAIAVASGPYIYVYKNLRPYFKFTLPALSVDPAEQQAWTLCKEGSLTVSGLVEQLDNIRAQGVCLSVCSLQLLSLPASERVEYCVLYKDTPLKKQTVITCVSTMKKSMDDDTAINCLLLGTETHQIYVLDPQAFTVLSVMNLADVPVFIEATGLFDVEFTMIIACRNGGVYGLKRGISDGRFLFKLTAQPVGLHRMKNKTIVVACMDETLQCYSIKGKRLWVVRLGSPVLTTCMLDHESRGVNAVMVALGNGDVVTYMDKLEVDRLGVGECVTSMKCGRFGREEASLIMTTTGGGLIVKMLKRSAHFDVSGGGVRAGPPVAQGQRLDIPRKTKLYLDQTIRERESCSDMYRQFQQDLYRLRLDTARKYVGVLNNSLTPISTNQAEPLTLHAEVTGIGPTFKLKIKLQNTSNNQASHDLSISYDYDPALYSLDNQLIQLPTLVPGLEYVLLLLLTQLPTLVPGLEYVFCTLIHCLSDKGISDIIKVFVLKNSSSSPIITAIINMPVSEALLVV